MRKFRKFIGTTHSLPPAEHPHHPGWNRHQMQLQQRCSLRQRDYPVRKQLFTDKKRCGWKPIETNARSRFTWPWQNPSHKHWNPDGTGIGCSAVLSSHDSLPPRPSHNESTIRNCLIIWFWNIRLTSATFLQPRKRPIARDIYIKKVLFPELQPLA